MKPVIALVGRANVGKSTLFNRLTKSRDAIVADLAGLTRDRHYGNASHGKREFIVVDTGGFEPDTADGILREMAKQTRQAVAEADGGHVESRGATGFADEDGPLVEALVAVGEPMSAEHRSAAWAVVPMGCHVVVGLLAALGPTVCPHQFPTDAHEHQWL